jgi:glycosyltransferase involved in cell wall biosynthesis
MDTMKILHVIPGLSPSLGGPPQVALNLVYALRECGVDAEIVATNYDGSGFLDVPLNQRINYHWSDNPNCTVPVWFLPYQPPALKEFIFSPALTKWLWNHIQEYDVLDNHYLFSYAPTCAATIARWKGVPYTVRTMGQLTSWALAQSRSKKQIYTALAERRNLQRAAAIHCTSPSEIEDVHNFGIKTPTITLPLGVNIPTIDPEAKAKIHQQYNIPADTPIVLFLSRLHYKKRPELLLESLRQLQADGRNFHVILAGSGEASYVSELQSLANQLGIADRISLPGMVVGQEKDLLFQGSDLFVLPSFSENFGIAVAEALVVGLPVVITPGIQIAADIAAAQAGLVVEGEVNLLAEAITQLLTNPERRQQMGKNGIKLAKERYSWRTIAQHLIPAYQTIATQKKLMANVGLNQPAEVQ